MWPLLATGNFVGVHDPFSYISMPVVEVELKGYYYTTTVSMTVRATDLLYWKRFLMTYGMQYVSMLPERRTDLRHSTRTAKAYAINISNFERFLTREFEL